MKTASMIKESTDIKVTKAISAGGVGDEDGSDIFDIDDFTCATPFEKFVSSLEEQLHQWNIGIMPSHHHHPHTAPSATSTSAPPPQLTTASSIHSSTPPTAPLIHQTLITLSGRSFQLALYHSNPPSTLRSTPASTNAASPSSALLALPLRVDHVSACSEGQQPHMISTCFGVFSFLLLTPAATHVEQPVGRNQATSSILSSTRRVSKNEASMLLSALSLASNNAQCVLPAFVSVDEGVKQLYWGRTCYGSVVRFDARCSDEIPTSFRHLTGLTDAFQLQRERIEGRGTQTGAARTLVAVSFSYQQETKKWGYNDIGALHGTDGSDEDDHDVCRWRDVSEDAFIGFGCQWGPKDDPLVGLRLTASWPFFPEGTFVDNAVYSDLDGLAAPNWRLDVDWRQDDSINPIYSSFTPLTTALQIMIDISQQGSKLPSLAAVLGSVPDTPATLASLSRQPSTGSEAEEKEPFAPLSKFTNNDTSNPLSALRMVQSSLRAHIDDANKIAAHGESVSAEYMDRVMKELLDIEHSTNSPKPNSSPAPRPSPSPTSPTPLANSFPFFSLTPIDPFSTTPYPASPADPPIHAQLVPYGSLLSRFVFALFETADTNQLTLRTVAAMWNELVTELRFHFETGLPIPKLLSSDTPDFGMSLLHQKIQLLQRCIRIQNQAKNQRKKTTAKPSISSSSTSSSKSASASKSTPDWKQPWTFQSSSSTWSEEKLSGGNSTTSSKLSSHDGWNDLDDLTIDDSNSKSESTKSGWGDLDISIGGPENESDEEDATADSKRAPEGVESTIANTFLLLTHAPMRQPVTQEVRVMTSDKFEEQQEMFARMGSGPDASRMRTEMQTAGLLSDMQAFKAANPGCILEDFVRWHSPKDWRASDAHPVRGELSQRMRKKAGGGEGNIWQKLWSSATPTPASEQKQLFDPAVEGEQLLNYLENVEPSVLFSQLLGISLQNCLCLLARTRGVSEQLQPVLSSIHKLSHYLKNYNRGNIPQDLHLDFSSCELLCSKATTLLLTFMDGSKSVDEQRVLAIRELIQRLLLHGCSDGIGPGSPLRTQLTPLFTSSTARTKPPSLFHSKPFNYANSSTIAVESVGSASTTLPKPDVSEFTFFAPSSASITPNQGHTTSSAPASLPSTSSPISVFGSRTYVALRHTHSTNSTSLQGATGGLNRPKFRYCTSIMHQVSPAI